MTKKVYTSLRDSTKNYANFQDSFPRSINGTPHIDGEKTKTANMAPNMGDLGALSSMAGGNIYRNPSRRFYDPEVTTTAIYLPRTLKQKNRWRRWFYDHDEFIGAVLELHSELPYSRAEIICEDKSIKRHMDECVDRTKLFSKLPQLDLEYLKIGEVFINTPWDNSLGMWSHIIPHNPDFVEVSASPFAEDNYVIELIPDDQLKAIINSTKPHDQQLKRRLPADVIRRVTSGQNLLLDPDEVTHISRKSNPYDLRGTSILDRIFRLLMYEDKLREAQITIADNFIYPLKIFKLGDPQQGWIPNASHQAALAQMLQQATLDPNFALIYHYGLQVEYVTVADKVMRLDPEWNEINNKKAIALGVSQQFITGETTYASANVGLQTQLARYKAKRDLFEINWLRNKFFRVMAERNDWYRRDKKELVGQYRVARKGIELEERLILPKIVWHKKLMMRDDQNFLTFMSNIYANGKGPLSTITMLQAMGLELDEELTRKRIQEELEDRIGAFVHPPPANALGGGGGGILPSFANFKNKFIKKANSNEEILEEHNNLGNSNIYKDTDFFTKNADTETNFVSKGKQEENEKAHSYKTYAYIKNSLMDEERHAKLDSHRLDPLFVNLVKKAQDLSFANDKELNLIIRKVYGLGKNYAYNKTGFIPYTNFKVSGLLGEDEYLDYSDVVNINKFEEWLSTIFNEDNAEIIDLISLLFSVYCHGQITGYEEQGIFNVRLTNVPGREGLCFKSNDVLKNGINLSGLLSPDLDVPLFDPFITGITNVDVAEDVYNLNTLDSQVNPYKTFYVYDTEVNNCPIELLEESEELYNKIYRLLKNEGISHIKYVDDITETPEWEENQITEIKLELEQTNVKNAMDPMTKNLMVSSKLKAEKDINRDCLYFAKIGDCLLVSNAILKNRKSLTHQLFKDFNFLNNEKNKSLIQSRFALNNNLNSEEIKVSLLYNYVLPIYDDKGEVAGYKVNDAIKNATSINAKLVKQGLWDKEGNVLNTKQSSPLNLFLENIDLYVNYPYKLDDTLKICYGSINGKA